MNNSHRQCQRLPAPRCGRTGLYGRPSRWLCPATSAASLATRAAPAKGRRYDGAHGLSTAPCRWLTATCRERTTATPCGVTHVSAYVAQRTVSKTPHLAVPGSFPQTQALRRILPPAWWRTQAYTTGTHLCRLVSTSEFRLVRTVTPSVTMGTALVLPFGLPSCPWVLATRTWWDLLPGGTCSLFSG